MWKRLRACLADHWLGIRVVGAFLGLIVLFFTGLTYRPIVERVDVAGGLAQVSAWLSWWILRGIGALVGFTVSRAGTILGSGPFEVDVSPACSGAVPTVIYVSAVLAYPASWRAKVVGTALGILLVNGLNLLRVVALFLIGLYRAQIFHETHVYVAQALVVAVAVVTWLFWAGRFAHAAGR